MKIYWATVTLATLVGFSLLSDAGAAQSLTKSYKVSVTLPQAVGISPLAVYHVQDIPAEMRRRHEEITVIVRNNQKMLLKTTVVE